MKDQIDFTKGPIVKQLIAFAVPILMGELLQNLYNSVDALVAGNFVSDSALGAVSVCASLAMLMIGFFNGVSIGTTVVIARIFGEKDYQKLQKYIRVIITATIFLGTVLSIIGMATTKVLVQLSKADADIFEDAVTYLRVYLCGLLFTVLYNVGAGILRAIGDSKYPFYFLAVSGGLNIALDLFLVLSFSMGVSGIALATTISQLISALLVLWRINRTIGAGIFDFDATVFHGKEIIFEVMSIGIPTGIQNALVAFSNLFVWRYVNIWGSAATSGIGICQRVEKFVILPVKACGNTTAAFVSQNIGAKNQSRSRKGAWWCFVLTMIVGVILEVTFIVFANPISRFFDKNQEIIDISATMIKTIFPFFVTFALREVMYGVLRGYGYTQITTLLSLLGMIGARQAFLAITTAIHPSIWNVYYCYPVAWGSTAFFVACYFLILKKKKKILS